jgi:hypothetical protein
MSKWPECDCENCAYIRSLNFWRNVGIAFLLLSVLTLAGGILIGGPW